MFAFVCAQDVRTPTIQWRQSILYAQLAASALAMEHITHLPNAQYALEDALRADAAFNQDANRDVLAIGLVHDLPGDWSCPQALLEKCM